LEGEGGRGWGISGSRSTERAERDERWTTRENKDLTLNPKITQKFIVKNKKDEEGGMVKGMRDDLKFGSSFAKQREQRE
jgi:hypothetical protein